jgi:hypothetical protein
MAKALILAFALVCAASARAQMTVGDQFHLSMNGSLGASYDGSFGKDISSSHGLGLGLNGVLDGYYFNPNFLSFHVRPYYDRMQSNEESQTLSRGSGVESSISLFGGSHFPGSISYGRDFNNDSEFRIAGVPSVLGSSSGSNMDISWSALLKGLPSFHANYLISNSTSTLLGTTDQSKSSSKSFSLNSDYKFGGFSLHGNLNHYNTEFLSPNFLTPEIISNASTSTHYSVTAMRRLPLSGSLALAWSRTNSENGPNDSENSSYSASLVLSPLRRLTVSETWNYTTNVIAAFEQSLAGDQNSSLWGAQSGWGAMYLNTLGTLTMGRGISISGHLNHRIQYLQGRTIEDTQYGGNMSFRESNRFLGFLHFSVGLLDTATQEGNSGVGLVSNLSMTRKFGRWDTSADVSYSQFTQTLFSVATTSNYGFGGSLRRKINSSTHWSASLRESHSGLTTQDGNNNVSYTGATNLSWNRYSFSSSYAQSNGAAVLGADGSLNPTPLGPVISTYFLTFNARSFGINSTFRLLRPLTVFSGYTNVSSRTNQRALDVFNNGDRFNVRLELRLRRLNIFAGVDRAVQESSAISGGQRAVNSYYVSLARWFNVF